MSTPITVSAAPVVDIKANGADGTVTINDGDSYAYTWTSDGATQCVFTSPFPSGVTLNGNSSVAPGEVLYYPTLVAPVTITMECNNNGTATATDSVVNDKLGCS